MKERVSYKKAPVIEVDGPMYSIKFYSDKRTSEYDIILPQKYGVGIISDDERLGELLYLLIFRNHPGFDIEACLNYQYDKCTINKVRFINFTKDVLTTKPYNQFKSDHLTEHTVNTILKWYDRKKNQLDSAVLTERQSEQTMEKPKVFFSYAWNEASEAIVTKLYNSLKQDGYPVVMDKTDLHYKESISKFMQTIGRGDVVVVAISDKYLTSDNCMFELYELYRNSNLEKQELLKKIYPIRVEEINLHAPETINAYCEHWRERVEKFKSLVVSHDYDQEQYLRIKNIYDSLGKLLPFLNDINASTKKLLSENNFAAIKNAIADRIK